MDGVAQVMSGQGHNSGATPHLDRAEDLAELRRMDASDLKRVADELRREYRAPAIVLRRNGPR